MSGGGEPACRKQRFETEADAIIAIRSVKRRKKLDGDWTAYRCETCRKFHFGHTPKLTRQIILADQQRRRMKRAQL